ncbi:MAG: hypothetical protein AAGI45_13345 [Cyanobacteria bacterium P01_H01_bin.26]
MLPRPWLARAFGTLNHGLLQQLRLLLPYYDYQGDQHRRPARLSMAQSMQELNTTKSWMAWTPLSYL